MAIFLKKNDTSIWNVYLSDSRKKRTIQNNPARFLLFLLDATSMSGSPPSFSDYLYFYSFMNRKIHAHFHWQPISIVRYCSFSFFRDYKSGLPSVLPHLARSETAHTPGSSHRQYRRSLCKPPRTEYASLSLSHIFRIHLRTAWLSFSLGKGSAREIPFFL